MNELAQDVAALMAKRAIEEVIHLRARASDRRDRVLAEWCYHEGATEDHGGFVGDARDYLDQSLLAGEVDPDSRPMWHSISNLLIELDDTCQQATTECYWFLGAGRSLHGVQHDVLMGGRYLDELALRGGRWGLTRRQVVFDWSRVEPSTASYWGHFKSNPADLLIGRPGGHDPLYSFGVDRGAPDRGL